MYLSYLMSCCDTLRFVFFFFFFQAEDGIRDLIVTGVQTCALPISTLFLIVTTRSVSAQEEPLCVENSPERRGEIGCSIIENKPLPGNLKEPLFWHIDRFGTGERARAAVVPASIAFEAHGAWWLMALESQTDS